MKASFANVLETEFVVTGLIEDQVYEFRVIARNAAGVFSQPSDSTGAITAKDEVDPPKIDLDAKYSQAVVVNAGETFKLEANIYGKPVPIVHWLKEGQEITEAARTEVKNTDFTACIVVKEAIRVDGGQYTLLVKNVGGEKSMNINVKVLDRPGPPDGPICIYGVTSEKCSISWKSPLQDGGSDVSHYIVERRETSRLVWTVVEPKVQTLNLKITKLLPGNEYIFRVIPVNKYGIGEPLESEPVIARNSFVAPSPATEVMVSTITKDSMVVTWERPTNDGGSPIQGYVVEKRDKDGVRWTRCNKRNVSELRFRVTGLLESHSYEFRVSGENAAGVGTPSTPTIYYKALDPIFKPGPPNNPKVVDTSRSTVSLKWGKPIYDGGCEIQSYIVEACNGASDEWFMCTPPTGISDTKFTVKRLLEKHEYQFRVCAINKIGVGEHADVPGKILLEEKLESPDLELDADMRKMINIRSASTLRLFVPVRGRPAPEVKWGKADGEIKETDNKYDFRVIARNAAGAVSKPSESTGSITAKDEVDPPNYETDPIYNQTLVINAGDTFSLEANVNGKPIPAAQWFKGDIEVENSARAEIKNTDFKSVLVVKDAIRVDGGQYTLVLTNVAGTKTVPFSVKVLDRPGPSEGPLTVSNVTEEKCSLSWLPPRHDGGASISYYIIQKRETSRLAWTVVSGDCGATMFKVTKLLKGNEYIFRVMAVNKYGEGEPLESDPVIMRNPFVPPGPPQELEITNITRDSMTVCWNRPESTGGSDINNYIVEKRDRAGVRWTKCNKRRVTDLRFRVTGLTEDHEYEFRVSAENTAGAGQPSPPTHYLKACDPTFEPGCPTNAHVVDTTKDSIIVAWHRPIYDGGCEIQGYAVEITKADEEEWTICTPPSGVSATTFIINKLIELQEYKVRICAMNKLGVGEPTEVQGVLKPMDKIDPPEVILDSVLRKGIVVRAGGAMRINVPFKGRPTPEISWAKEDGELSSKVQIETGEDYTQLSVDICDKYDAGKYILNLENSAGAKSAFVSVKVLDTPGAPVNLTIKDIKRESVTLTWEPPLIDGGSRIKNYLVEKRDSTRIVYTCEGTVTGLSSGQEYLFRVSAFNEKGKSDPRSLAAPVTAKDVTIEPRFKLTFNTYSLPIGDNLKMEIPVIGRPVPKVEWKKDGQALKETTRLNVSSTPYSTKLFIKDANREDAGKYTVTATSSIGTVTEEISLGVTEVTKESLTLAWAKPEQDGGSRITGYLVEALEKGQEKWVKCGMSKSIHLTVSGLRENAEYFFRVRAKNLAGFSDAKEMVVPVMVKDQIGESDSSIDQTIILKTKLRFEDPLFRYQNTLELPLSTITSVGT
uniref:Titin n=1 Tax=Gouania willdenowi TaxID=441366 RepID=A0A8C5G3L8_GOUWI